MNRCSRGRCRQCGGLNLIDIALAGYRLTVDRAVLLNCIPLTDSDVIANASAVVFVADTCKLKSCVTSIDAHDSPV